jgi:hypothetical protein
MLPPLRRDAPIRKESENLNKNIKTRRDTSNFELYASDSDLEKDGKSPPNKLSTVSEASENAERLYHLEISLRMKTRGTHFRRGVTVMHISAISALPSYRLRLFKN